MNSIFSRILLIFLFIITIIACDKDVNEIGANLVGKDNYGFASYTDANIVAYTQKIGPIQTNNLPVNQIGIYDNKVFGKTVASFASQLQLPSGGITIAGATTVTSVTLNVPYYVTKITANSDGTSKYRLDSISGNFNTAKIKLSVYRNGFNIFGPNDLINTTLARNFSNQLSNVDGQKIGGRLNNLDASQNDEFQFLESEFADTSTSTTVYSPPAMRLRLDNSMGTNILALPTATLTNAFNFTQAYKGLYFKVEQSGTNDGCLAMMNFDSGTVTINYTEGSGTTLVNKSFILNLSGNTLNLYDNQPSGTFYESLPNTSPNATTTGDKKLYIKGGEGSVAMIDLFGKDLYGSNGTSGVPNRIPDELDIIKTKGWLINEANLTFNIDKSANGMAAEPLEPKRILVYDVNNKRPMIDYIFDASAAKSTHGGFIEKTASTAKGDRYKIRLTNYVRTLINNDSTNVRLGLSIWKTALNTTFGKNNATSNANFNFFPNNNIMSPLGTVLYGTNYLPTDADYAKRLKLEIWYTKPN